MTRSTSINNAELRKMSTPIPISVNTWQMRSPNQFLNTEDSNQFDPGIMEQCISQSSISPSSAASYSFSPIAYNQNNNNNSNINNNQSNNLNNANNLNSGNSINSNNNPNLNSHNNQIYVNQPQMDRDGAINTNNQNVFTINNPMLNTNNTNHNNILNSLNQFNYDNYSSVDLTSTNDFFDDERNNLNTCNLVIENDLATLNSNIYEVDNNMKNVSLPVDLESLLINATLSDHSSHNILISSPNLDSGLNDTRTSDYTNDDTNDEQNVNNNINPMFLFNKTNNNTNFNSQTQTQGGIEVIDFNNNSNNENKKFITQSNKVVSPILSQAPSQRPNLNLNNKSTFQNSFQIQQRKIVEENEDAFNLNQNIQLQYFNDNNQSQQRSDFNNLLPTSENTGIATSLPADSYFQQKNAYNITSNVKQNRMNQSQHSNNYVSNGPARNINQLINAAANNHHNSDPVLTQVQLNSNIQSNLTKENAQQYNNNGNGNSNSNNRKISYLLSQQGQQQYHQNNMVQNAQNNYNSNNYVNNNSSINNNSTSLSLPTNAGGYSNLISYEFKTEPLQQPQQHQIKEEPKDPKHFEDNDEKFSKLKLSSPGSSSTTSNSSSSSSSSANFNNNSMILLNNNEKDNQSVDLDNIMASSDIFQNPVNDDVLSVLNSPLDPQNISSSNNNNKDLQGFYNQMNNMVDIADSNNLASDDQTVVEEYFKFANDLENEELKRNKNGQGVSGRVRRRATVSFSKNDNEQDDDFDEENSDYEDDYENDEDYEDFEGENENNRNNILFDTGTRSIAINRRRSSRSISGVSSGKLSKSFSAQNTTNRRQLNINQLCVGSVGSSSQLYMQQQQQQQQAQQQRAQINSRKHARTSGSLSFSHSGGVDVHSQSQNQGASGSLTPVKHLTSSSSKDMFSNLQFSPFSSNVQNNQNQMSNQGFQLQVQQQQNLASNKDNSNNMQQSQHQAQSQAHGISSSLPATHNFDSMMMILNNNVSNANNTSNNHPNLNKLLLNNSIGGEQQKLPVFSNNNSPFVGASSVPTNSGQIKINARQTKLTQKKQQSTQKSPNKKNAIQKTKRIQKSQNKSQFDDSDDNEDENDSDFSDEELIGHSKNCFSKKSTLKSIKMEDSDFDEDSDTEDDDNDSNDALNTTRNSVASSSSQLCQSGPSSFANSESLFDLMMSSKNRDAYFWQYNIQSKGPKTKKVLTLRNKDPHLHRDFFDPVFQLQSLNARGGTAVNKLRKGDGNDVTPNPEKLYNLGNQIRDFIQKSYLMNSACFSPPPPSITSSSLNQIGINISNISNNNAGLLSCSVDTAIPKEKTNLKREKNKIASRACRLKKKAQHEANKIKLFGLNDEHKQLLDCISSARELIRTKLTNPHNLPGDKKMIDLMDETINQKSKTKLAGNSDGYVHMLMLQVEKDRANNRKSGILDLNNLNQQFALFQQHEKQVLNQQQNIQQSSIKQEKNEGAQDQSMDQASSGSGQPFMFNENTFSPQTPLQF